MDSITTTAKNFGSTFIWSKNPGFGKLINNLVNGGEVLYKGDEQFKDIIYELKRSQLSASLVNILQSDRVVLKALGKPMPKSLSTVYAMGKGFNKTYIDITNIITIKNGVYAYKDRTIDVLMSNVISAGMMNKYFSSTRSFTANSNIIKYGTEAYVSLFTYIIDYLRINGYTENKSKISYAVALFFQCTMLSRGITDSVKNYAISISKCTPREASVVDYMINNDDLLNLDTLIKFIAKLLGTKELTTEVFIDKWIYNFGASTYFASELFISFSSMLTDTYVGAYINNQKGIEKVINSKVVLTGYVNELFRILGGDL